MVEGNKPITIGHQYSALVELPEKSDSKAPPWVVPLVLRRITTAETELQVGAEEIDAILKDPSLPFHKELTVDVLDSKYSVVTFLGKVADNENAVHIARSRGNRVYYRSYVPPKLPPGQPRPKGRPTWYGERFALKEPNTWGQPDAIFTTTHTSKRGHTYAVIIES